MRTQSLRLSGVIGLLLVAACSDDAASDGTTPVEETVEPPARATGAAPEAGAADVALDASLSWNEAVDAVSYDLYWGSDLPAVALGVSGGDAFIANQTETTYAPAGLEQDTTYYWRVDSVGVEDTTLGAVWSFTTEAEAETPPAGAVGGPTPTSGASDVALELTLSWTEGANAVTYDVFFGDDAAAIAGAEAGQATATGSDTSWSPEPLQYGTRYYWRVDTVGAEGGAEGPLWSFTTIAEEPPLEVGVVSVPSPESGAVDVALEPNLGWLQGTNAISYAVYIGDDPAQVAAGTTPIETTTSTGYQPAGLEHLTTYYWRVDAIGAEGLAVGPLWSFTTLAGVAPDAVTTPMPSDGVFDSDVDLGFSWAGGDGATGYQLYLGTDATRVLTAAPGSLEHLGEVDGTTWASGAPLDYDAAYFWRVDAENEWGTTTGPVWAFGTRQTPNEPWFSGAGVAHRFDATTVGVRWFEADDLEHDPSDMAYHVFVRKDGDAYPDDPAVTVRGATSATLGAAQLPAGADSSGLVVRVVAESPNALLDHNDVEIVIPPVAATAYYVDGTSPTSTGTLAEPFQSLQEAVTAAESGDDATIYLAAGTYAESVDLADGGSGRLTMVGGFPSFATSPPADAAALAASWDSATHETILMTREDANPKHILALGTSGRDVVLRTVTLDMEEGAITGEAVSLTIEGALMNLMGNADEPDVYSHVHLEHENTTRGIALAVTGTTIDGGWTTEWRQAFEVRGLVDSIAVRANRIRDVSGDVLRGTGELLTPTAGTTIEFASNDVLRVARMFDVDVEALPGETEGDLLLDVHDNRVRGTGSEAFLVEVGLMGSDAEAQLLFHRNQLSQLGLEPFDISTQSVLERGEDDAPDLHTSRPDVVVELVENLVRNADQEVFYLRQTLVGDGASLSVLVQGNSVLGFGNDGFVMATNDYDVELLAGDSGDVDIVITGNTFLGADSCVDLEALTPVTGSYAVTVTDNRCLGDQPLVDIAVVGFAPTVGPNAADLAIDLIVADNWLESVSGAAGVDIDLARLPGADLELTVRDNLVDAAGAGIDLAVTDWAPDHAVEEPAAHYAINVFNNEIIKAYTDGILFDYTPEEGGDVNLWVANNTVRDVLSGDLLDVDAGAGLVALLERNALGPGHYDGGRGIQMYNWDGDIWVRNSVIFGAGEDGVEHDTPLNLHNLTVVDNAGDDGYFGIHYNRPREDDPSSLWGILAHRNGYFDIPERGAHAHYSMVTRAHLLGVGSFEDERPRFALCDDPYEFNRCFALTDDSPARDAGRPGARFNDPDGTRNDIGAFGGPHAGWIGYREGAEMPLVLVGTRPISELGAGGLLHDPDSPIHLDFQRSSDWSTDLPMVSGPDGPVSGGWTGGERRLTFTPRAPFAPGTHYLVTMTPVVEGGLRAPEWREFTTAVTPTTGNDPEDYPGGATVLADPVVIFRDSTTSTDPDVFSIPVEAGDRLMITVDAGRRDSNDSPEIILLAADETTWLAQSEHAVGGGKDPYVDQVFETAQTVYLEVGTSDDHTFDYDLYIVRRPTLDL